MYSRQLPGCGLSSGGMTISAMTPARPAASHDGNSREFGRPVGPVVEDVRQEVGVRALWDGIEEVTTLCVVAARVCLERRVRHGR